MPIQLTNQDLTDRWTALRSHAVQSRLFHTKKRFAIVPAGRQSGKTENAKRKLAGALIEHDCDPAMYPWLPRFFAAAPTRDQVKEVWWEDMKALVPSRIVEEISETRLSIRTRRGAFFRLIGLDKPQRIEGVQWDGGVIDELADCKPGIFDAHVFPMLAHRNGWCWLIGVPDRNAPGQVEYAGRVKLAQAGTDPDWAYFWWPMSDIAPPAQIDSMRRTMDPEMFRQEVMGEFILTGGLAFPDFSAENISDKAVYDPALPLCWALDFNVEPMCSLAIQHHKGQVRVLSEIVPPGKSSTYTACEAFDEWCDKNKADPRQVAVYGDATGNARDSTSRAGTTDWTIIRDHLRNRDPRIKVPGKSPYIKDTLNAVRARIKNAAGERNLIVHHSCKRLIKEFGELLWPSDLEAGHCMAALRYFCEWEYRVSAKREAVDSRFSV